MGARAGAQLPPQGQLSNLVKPGIPFIRPHRMNGGSHSLREPLQPRPCLFPDPCSLHPRSEPLPPNLPPQNRPHSIPAPPSHPFTPQRAAPPAGSSPAHGSSSSESQTTPGTGPVLCAGTRHEAHNRLDAAMEVRQVELLVRRVDIIVGQAESHQNAGNA